MEHSRNSSKREAKVIRVDEGELKKHVSEIVRESVEDTLNSLLEAEAHALQAWCHIEWQVNDPVPNVIVLAAYDMRRMQHPMIFGDAFFDGTQRIAFA